MQAKDDKNYEAVGVEVQHDSDEELQLQKNDPPKLVIEDDEEMKEVQHQNNPDVKKEESKNVVQDQQQQQQQQKIQEKEYPKIINYNYQDINIRIKKEWLDRVKNAEPPLYEKKAYVEIKGPVLFTLDKDQRKHGRSIFSQIFYADYRYFYILDGYLYILHLKNDKMFVKSVQSLKRLFKILLKDNIIELCFINSELDKSKPAKVKIYRFLKGEEQKGKLLMRLRGELNKLGQDYDFLK